MNSLLGDPLPIAAWPWPCQSAGNGRSVLADYFTVPYLNRSVNRTVNVEHEFMNEGISVVFGRVRIRTS